MPSRKFSPILSRSIPQKISVKLGLIICALVLILLSALGMGLTHITRDVLKMKVQQNLEETARRVSREIALFVHRPVELLEISSQLIGRLQSKTWDQETVLVEMSIDFPMFEEIISVNLEGEQVATSNPSSPETKWKHQAAYQETIQGQTYLSPIYISDNHLPYITTAVPYYFLGKVKGALIAKVNLRGMWEIVDGVQIGQTGRAFLMSEEGILIAHPDKKLVLQNRNLSSIPEIKTMLVGQEGSVEYQFDQTIHYVASLAPVRGTPPFITVVQMERSEAYRLLDQMRFLIWCMIGFSLVLSMMVSFLLARWLVRPVRALQFWSRKVALGDFDYYVPPKSSDEIGRLFMMFRRMSQRLKRAREKEHLALLGEAATAISHKLKNIIASLKTFSQLIPKRKKDLIFMEKFETIFSYNVDYLEEILKNLSQVSSLSEVPKDAVHLESIFEYVHRTYQETMDQAKIVYHLNLAPDLPTIYGNGEQIRELLLNMIQNSMQAMPRGGLLQVQVKEITSSSLVQIQIQDTGCGISKNSLDKIFKPFYTTRHGGMGLGLSICKKIVESHQGHIVIHSTQGKGTKAVITFPVYGKKKITIQDPLVIHSKQG